jgi:hypothetical protein
MRIAMLKGAIVDNVLEADPESAALLCERLACDGYIIAPIEDRAFWALGPGATVQGIAAARIPGSLEIDRGKITGIVPPPADA